MANFTLEDWMRHHERIRERIKDAPASYRLEMAIEAAQELLACSYALAGIACPGCGGMGEKAHGDTSIWAGGIGGQAITTGVCDKCWGTGRTDKTGVNLRRYRDLIRTAGEVVG